MIHQFPFFYFRLRFLPFPPDSGTSLETTIEASIGFGLIYGSMAREINQSEPEITADASGGTSERIRTWRGRHQQMADDASECGKR